MGLNIDTKRVLFINSVSLELDSLRQVRGPSVSYEVVHAADPIGALDLLSDESFRVVLWVYDAPGDYVRFEQFLRCQRKQLDDEVLPAPVICVVRDGNDQAAAEILSRTTSGYLFAGQLQSPDAVILIEALIDRIAQKALLEGAQEQLVHAEKFAAMGLLAAEIAHEINNPASFVISNLSVMIDYVRSIVDFMEGTRARVQADAPQISDAIAQLAAHYEIDYLKEDLDELLGRSLNGMQRIHQIVQDLRFFSHDTDSEPGWINIERLLETTLNLVKYEAKTRAYFKLDFCGDAEIFSDANRLSQVFLNILVNALHSIEAGKPDRNHVDVKTRRDDRFVVITIEDTGSGMTPEVLERIFQPFYTTKQRGEGSGLGLSISRDIVQSLGGQIAVSSDPGVGSIFEVRLPIRAAKFERDEQIRDSGNYTAVPEPGAPKHRVHDADDPYEDAP